MLRYLWSNQEAGIRFCFGRVERVKRLKKALGAFTLVGVGLLLAGCITDPVRVSGSGVIAVSWDGTVERGSPSQPVPQSWGDTILFCSASASACDQTNWQYAYLPPELSTSVQISAGVSVYDTSYSAISLPAGAYKMRVVRFIGTSATPVYSALLETFTVEIGGAEPERDLSIWHRSIGRESAESRCPSDFTPSWAQWPNEGKGGFVCNKMIYKYYPDEPVYVSGTPDLSDWRVSIARSSRSADCPDGATAGWARWPKKGAGGFVCNAYGGF